MARENTPEELSSETERSRLANEKKQLKDEQRSQRREAKKRAKEIARQEDALEDEEGNGLLTFGATVFIVAIWLAVVCVIVKLDVGGFGSSVLTPLLKDVPVVNLILPNTSSSETSNTEDNGGYASLQEAVEQIKALELQLESVQTASAAKDEELNTLKAEVIRLQEFENAQTDFQRIRTEFYEEVVYAEKGPGAEAFQKYYESMNPAIAEHIYKQVVTQLEESKEIQDYAATYSQMKPKQAAGIFEAMENDLELVARILRVMSAEERGAIMGVMDSEVAGKLTKILNPES